MGAHSDENQFRTQRTAEENLTYRGQQRRSEVTTGKMGDVTYPWGRQTNARSSTRLLKQSLTPESPTV